MRVLAVVYCLPPLLVPAAMCYLKLLLGLREHGVTVEALAIDSRTFAAPDEGLADPSLLAVVPSDLVVHRVRSPETNPMVQLLKRSPVHDMFYPFFQPRKREWTLAARRVLGRLDLSSYDVVLTCSQPHANHLLGLEIKRRTGKPWVAYFSDPWSKNPYARPTSPRIAAYLRGLEARVLAEADSVLFTSPEMERLALREFPGILPGKTGVVPHGYVPGWYDRIPPRAPEAGPIRILHTGHFYGPRSPAPLLQALHQLPEQGDLASRLAFTFHGTFPADVLAGLRGTALESVVRIHGTIPYLESLALMRGHDACLLVDAPLRHQAESVFLPSKLVDYLGSGKPVIALTPPEGATARVIREVGGHSCDVADVEGIRDLFREVMDGVPLRTPDPEKSALYHYVHVAHRLLEHLSAVAS